MTKMFIFDTFWRINTLQHHGVCLQNGLAMQTTLILIVVSYIKGFTQLPEHILPPCMCFSGKISDKMTKMIILTLFGE